MKRADLIIFTLVLAAGLIGACFYFFAGSAGPESTIVIEVNGVVVQTYPLYQEGRDEYVEIAGVNGLTRVHLEDGRVQVVDSACPDKVCVNTGWIRNSAQVIACLPNRVIIKIVNAEDGDIDLR